MGFRQVFLDIIDLSADAVLDSTKLDGLLGRVKERVSRSGFHITDSQVRLLLTRSWCDALDKAVASRSFSTERQLALNLYRKHFELTSDDVGDEAYFDVLRMMTILSSLSDDAVIPRFDRNVYAVRFGRLPFNLLDSEELIWVFQNVSYLKLMTRLSKRLFRSDQYVASMEQADTGTLGISTRHLYFVGSSEVFRVGLDNLISIREYRDAIGFVRDTEGAKPEALGMESTDVWFAIEFIDAIRELKNVSPPDGDSPTLEELMGE
ncbi:MAG: hypothetical protein J4G14_14830 [Dehalococcoidia bacterium]|nr:hypothetical protein [Dehalococcoidia bacterium]